MSATRLVLRQAVTGAALLPASFGTVGAVLIGRHKAAGRWWAARAGRRPEDPARPGRFRLLAHAFLTLPLGLITLFPLAIVTTWVLRGVFYGLVDQGPYDHSWGGPTRAGAWLAHFTIGIPFAVAGVAALWGLAWLDLRLANRLWRRQK